MALFFLDIVRLLFLATYNYLLFYNTTYNSGNYNSVKFCTVDIVYIRRFPEFYIYLKCIKQKDLKKLNMNISFRSILKSFSLYFKTFKNIFGLLGNYHLYKKHTIREGGDIGLFITLAPKFLKYRFLICRLNNLIGYFIKLREF